MTVVDRRIERTRKMLHEALMALVVEVSYDSITVQQILDRANVGRSAFYTHFQDKDELLMWGTRHLQETLSLSQPEHRHAEAPEDVVRFSRAMFEHAYSYRKIYRALVATAVWPHLRQRIHNIIAEQVRRQYKTIKRIPRPRSKLPLELFVHYLASTLVTVLTWWFDHNSPLTPEEIDDVYRGLVLPAIRSAYS